MKEKLEKIDELLATLVVSGDEVITVASARFLLHEIYEEVVNNG